MLLCRYNLDYVYPIQVQNKAFGEKTTTGVVKKKAASLFISILYFKVI